MPMNQTVHRALLAAVALGTTPCLAQQASTPLSHATAFVEVAGNALLGATANLEFKLSPKVGLRAGGGLDIYTQTAVFPVQAVLLDGAGPSKLELSAGVTIAREHLSGDWHWDGTKPFLTGFAGYRYERPNGFMFRVGVVPILWTNAKFPWVAMGIGGAF